MAKLLRDVSLEEIGGLPIVVVTASTGVGKTEAACLWAGGCKLFYTLPLKVSINAIYERLHGEGKDGYGFRDCTLLHSDALSVLMSSEDEEYDPLEKYNRSRLFSYPVTVCTVDQLFTFVYRYRGSEIIPSVLKYSCVVIDEIQAYEPKIAAKLIVGLRMLHELGGAFAIITATMPPFLEDAIRRYRIPFEKPEPFYSDLPRHHLRYTQSDFDYEQIAKAACHGKVLVICNTVKKACGVYEALKDRTGAQTRLLHSRFQQKHRRRLEKDVMDFSNTPGNGIWISTQIVEASLDIDFDFLFTEMCTADSLLQRLGRCSRKRAYIANEPNVFVHETGNGVGTVYDTEIYTRSVQMLSQYCGRLFTEPEKNAYVCEVYDTKALKSTKYYKEFSKSLQTLDALPPAVFSAEEAKNKFRDIISVSVIDDETYHDLLNRGELALLSEELCSEDKRVRAEARQKLQDHTIQLNPQYAKVKPDIRSPIQIGTTKGAFPPVYRIQARYEFDEESGTGLGLIMEPVDHANFL